MTIDQKITRVETNLNRALHNFQNAKENVEELSVDVRAWRSELERLKAEKSEAEAAAEAAKGGISIVKAESGFLSILGSRK